jgi:hypothetical protein
MVISLCHGAIFELVNACALTRGPDAVACASSEAGHTAIGEILKPTLEKSMKVVVKNDEYTIYQRRDGRYAVENAAKKAVNGDEKVAILLANELVKVTPPAAPAEEPAQDVVEESAEETTAEAADEPAEEPAEEAGDAAAE